MDPRPAGHLSRPDRRARAGGRQGDEARQALTGTTRETLARSFFGLTAFAAGLGLVVQVFVTAGRTEGIFPTVPGRVFNLFCYFTVQSNVLVAVTTLLLALRPNRSGTVFAVFRLMALVAITITGIVFHVALKSLQDLQGSAAFADFLLHTASPVLCVAGWLLFGPRGLVSLRVVGLALLFPVGWLAFTLVRGPIVDYYPYPFLDVAVHGYARVLVNVVVVAAVFVLVALGALWLDRRLPGGAGGRAGAPRGT